MGVVDTARSGELKMKHFIIPLPFSNLPSCKPRSFPWRLPFLSAGLSPFGPPLSSPVLHCLWSLPYNHQCNTSHVIVSTASYLFHAVFLYSPQYGDIWLSTVTHPLCCKAATDYSSVHVIPSFHPQQAVHIFSRSVFLCQNHSECRLCPPALAAPPSLPSPGDLVSVLFPGGAKKGVRLSEASEHEGTTKQSKAPRVFSTRPSCSGSLVSGTRSPTGKHISRLLLCTLLSPAQAGQAFNAGDPGPA